MNDRKMYEEKIRPAMREHLERVAIDKRAAIECGIPEEEVDEYIVTTSRKLFDRFMSMTSKEMSDFMMGEIIKRMLEDPEAVLRAMAEVDEESEKEGF